MGKKKVKGKGNKKAKAKANANNATAATTSNIADDALLLEERQRTINLTILKTNGCRYYNCKVYGDLPEGENHFCLGVPFAHLPSEFRTEIPGNTIYGQLARPLRLGGSYENRIIPPEEATGDEVATVSQLWSGEFEAEVLNADSFFESNVFELAVIVPSTGKSMLIRYDNRTSDKLIYNNASQMAICLDEEMASLLAGRVLHQYIRQCGWRFPMMFLFRIIETLLAKFSSKKFLQASLDLCMIKADLVLNIYNHDDWRVTTGCCIVRVGEILEIMGRFEQASQLYNEVALSYLQNTDQEAKTLGAAGLACKRVQRYDEGLVFYLKALSLLGDRSKGGLDLFDNDEFEMHIDNLFLLEWEKQLLWMEQQSDGNTILGGDEMLFPTLSALLLASNYKMDDPEIQEHVKYFGEQCLANGIKPELKDNNKKAQRQLLRVLTSGTVSLYKERILQSVRQGMQYMTFPNEGERERIHINPNQQRVARKAARNFVQEQRTQIYSKCGSLICEKYAGNGLDFKWCSCKQVSYCSVECQKEHWKLHKATSEWHKKNGLGK